MPGGPGAGCREGQLPGGQGAWGAGCWVGGGQGVGTRRAGGWVCQVPEQLGPPLGGAALRPCCCPLSALQASLLGPQPVRSVLLSASPKALEAPQEAAVCKLHLHEDLQTEHGQQVDDLELKFREKQLEVGKSTCI